MSASARNAYGAATVALAFALLHAGVAHAEAPAKTETATASGLFQNAQKLMFSGRYAEACPMFAESQKLDPGIGTMLYLGDCWAKTGRTASALMEFRRARDLAAKTGDRRAGIAGQRAQNLEPVVPRLTIAILPQADVQGLEVQRDGVRVERSELKDVLLVDPGVHVITATAPGKKAWETRVEVMTAAAVVIRPLDDAAPVDCVPVAPVAAHEESPNPGGRQRAVGVVSAALGLASLAVGGIVGINSKRIYDESNTANHCAAGCDAYGTERRNQAFETARLSTAAMIGGAVLMGGGALLYITAPRRNVEVGFSAAPTPGGAAAGATLRW